MADVSCDVLKTIVSIPSDSVGWSVELNLISWGGRPAKYDIRKWNEDHSKSSKGITLSEDEAVIFFQNYKTIIKELTGEDV